MSNATPVSISALVEFAEDAIIGITLAEDPLTGKVVDGLIVHWNPSAARLLGFSADEVRSRPFSTLMPPERRTDLPALLEKLRRGEAVPSLDMVQMSKNGERIDVAASFAGIKGQDNKVTSAVIIGRDRSIHKRAAELCNERLCLARVDAEVARAVAEGGAVQALLERSAEALVKYLDAALACVWVFNAPAAVLELQVRAGGYPRLNGGTSRIPLGQGEIGQVAARRRIHCSNDLANDAEIVDKSWMLRNGFRAFAGLPLVAADQLHGVLGLYFRHGLGDQTRKALPAVAEAIASGLQRRPADSQREAEQLVSAIAEVLAEGCFVKDVQGRYLTCNAAGARFLGKVAEEIVGKTDHELFDAETARQNKHHDELALAGIEPLPYRETRTVAGAPWQCLIRKRPYRDAGGSILGLIGVVYALGVGEQGPGSGG